MISKRKKKIHPLPLWSLISLQSGLNFAPFTTPQMKMRSMTKLRYDTQKRMDTDKLLKTNSKLTAGANVCQQIWKNQHFQVSLSQEGKTEFIREVKKNYEVKQVWKWFVLS